MSKVEYNALIYDISEKIEETNLKLLKFVCRDHLGRNGPSKPITTVLELLLELENQNHLGIDRLDLLKEILTHLKKQKRSLLKKVDDFEVRRKAQSIGVISRLNRAADSLVGGVKLLCNFKTIGGIVLGVNVALVLRSCTTLEQFFEAFERVVLPALVKGKELFGGSLCFVVQAETASALKELWNFYKDGTLKNRLQEFLVTKEVQDLAGSDKVEVTVFIDEHEWREAYVNMLFHQNQADAVKGEQVGERRRRNSDSFIFLKSKEIHRTKMKLEQSENKWNFERQLLQQENEKLQMSNKQTEEGDEIAPELPSELEKELNLETGKEVVTEPLHQAKPSSKIRSPSIPSEVDPFRTDPIDERSLSYFMPPEREPVLRLSDLLLGRREKEKATTFSEIRSSSISSKVDPIPIDKRAGESVRKSWNSKTTGKEVVTKPLYRAKPSSKKRSPSISSEVDPFRTDPVDERSVSYFMPPEREPVLSLCDLDLRRRETESARRFQEVMDSSPSISSEVDPIPSDERAGECVRKSWLSERREKEKAPAFPAFLSPSISSELDPIPSDESSLSHMMLPEIQRVLSSSVPFLGRREKEKKEKATTFSQIRSPSISSELDPIRSEPRDESWYFGDINQRSAERILKDQNPGRFLVRKDSRGLERYVISWRDTDGYRHQEIEMFPDRMFVLRGKENLRFSSLEASVLHFITCSTNDMAMVPPSKEKGKIPSYERFLATSTDTPYPRLHLSVETGDTREIETLLSSGVDIDSRDRSGRTPLMVAAERGRENTFRLLIERGSDPTLKDSIGRSVLHWAAHGGSNEIIQELLSRGLDIDSRDRDGDTPLRVAIRFGRENAVRLLIERGSDPTSRDNMGQSILHWAAQTGRNEIIQALLSRGLDIDSRDRDGDTPVVKAAIYGKEDAITLLLERGSDPKQKDAKGRGLLHWAAQFGRDVLIENLLSLGLDINSRENYGDTPLMKAAYFSRKNAFSLLIERGSDPALTDNRGQSALHWAARGGSKVIIEKLLSLGLDINSKTNSGETPLMLATSSRQAEAVNYLLSRGAK